MNPKTAKIIIALLVIALLILIYLTFKTNLFFKQSTATTPPPSSSLQNSYLFASPLKAKADSQEKIRITVLLLDDQGKGISNQEVTLNYDTHITAIPLTPLTDQSGQISFDLSTSDTGEYSISAKTNNYTLPQSLNITFY